MIGYELAKRLREAGFPQSVDGEPVPEEQRVYPPSGLYAYGQERFWCRVPTTDDLLAELGDDFGSLYVVRPSKKERWWKAASWNGDAGVTADDPETALAGLYILLAGHSLVETPA